MMMMIKTNKNYMKVTKINNKMMMMMINNNLSSNNNDKNIHYNSLFIYSSNLSLIRVVNGLNFISETTISGLLF